MTRVRRSAESARHRILEAAERQLAERGADGVRVRDVAEALGVAPATILHHFGSRDELLEELLVYGARKLRDRLDELVAQARPDLVRLSSALLGLYATQGYAALYAALHQGGEAPERAGEPLFERLLERFRETRGLRTRRQREQLADAVLALNLVAFAEALVGTSLRTAVGLPDDAAGRARLSRWLGRLLEEKVGMA